VSRAAARWFDPGMRTLFGLGMLGVGLSLFSCGGDDDGSGSGGSKATGGSSSGGTSAGGASGSGGTSAGGASGSGGTSAGGASGSGASSSGGSAGTASGGTSAGGTSAGGTSAGGMSAGGTSAGGTSAGGSSATGGGGGTGGANSDIPGGGTVLFQEKFDDSAFTSRGWYDGPAGTISTAEHASASTSSFQCAFVIGATSCSGGKPARHKITPTETVYLSFWLKFSSNWVGSGKPYHPHMFHFLNNLDNDWVGPSHTYLTTYTEVVQGKAFLGLQDSKNVDLACILKNDDSFVGCSGSFATYPFTENRSVCACNGLAGYLQGRDCFSNGNGTWYSSRSWTSNNAFADAAGPNYKGDWHFVEVYFAMNDIQAGKGVPNGKIRWVQDGVTLIKSDQILLRTNAHATLKFSQFAMLPYIGDGSPVAQSFWVDDLTVATAKP